MKLCAFSSNCCWTIIVNIFFTKLDNLLSCLVPIRATVYDDIDTSIQKEVKDSCKYFIVIPNVSII